MKKLMMVLAIFSATFFTAQAQTADETAIKTVIEAETQAWHDGNIQKEIGYWNIQPYSRSLISLETGQVIVMTSENAKNAEQTAPDGGVAANSNYQIHINGNMAFSTHDQLTTEKSGTKRYAHEMRVLEKVDGKWKIIGLSAHLYKP